MRRSVYMMFFIRALSAGLSPWVVREEYMSRFWLQVAYELANGHLLNAQPDEAVGEAVDEAGAKRKRENASYSLRKRR